MPATFIEVDVLHPVDDEDQEVDTLHDEATRFVHNNSDAAVADQWYNLGLEASEMKTKMDAADSERMRITYSTALEEIAAKFDALETAIKAQHRYNRVIRAAKEINNVSTSPPPAQNRPQPRKTQPRKATETMYQRYTPSNVRTSSYGASKSTTPVPQQDTKLRFTEADPEEFTRVWEYDPPHTSGISRMAAEMSNADRYNFRDSHHGPGIRRSVTRGTWYAAAIGAEAFVLFFSRRVLAGDVPFDFLPRTRNDIGPRSIQASWTPEDEEEPQADSAAA